MSEVNKETRPIRLSKDGYEEHINMSEVYATAVLAHVLRNTPKELRSTVLDKIVCSASKDISGIDWIEIY